MHSYSYWWEGEGDGSENIRAISVYVNQNKAVFGPDSKASKKM